MLGTVAVTLAILPYTWSGGGGPPGNRYFMAVYPVLFFLLPPIQSLAVPLAASGRAARSSPRSSC